MAYAKHNWNCGESITADRLNNLEDGVEEALNKGNDKTIVELVGNGYGVITDASHKASEIVSLAKDRENVVLWFSDNNSRSTWHIYRLVEVQDSEVYMYGAATGRYVRFQSQIYIDDTNGLNVQAWNIDIFNPQGTDEYYWVYAENYNGRHE